MGGTERELDSCPYCGAGLEERTVVEGTDTEATYRCMQCGETYTRQK